jgi:sec-independent protein translocase protein TatC
MADDKAKVDELAGTEQPFVQHLVELRDRLIKIVIAIGIVGIVLALYPGPAALYDILAAPLIATLPKGATLIATSVISPFFIPLKILMMTAFLIALPVVLWQIWSFVAPGLYMHEKKLVLPLVISSTRCFSSVCCLVTTLYLDKFLDSFKISHRRASAQLPILKPI